MLGTLRIPDTPHPFPPAAGFPADVGFAVRACHQLVVGTHWPDSAVLGFIVPRMRDMAATGGVSLLPAAADVGVAVGVDQLNRNQLRAVAWVMSCYLDHFSQCKDQAESEVCVAAELYLRGKLISEMELTLEELRTIHPAAGVCVCVCVCVCVRACVCFSTCVRLC